MIRKSYSIIYQKQKNIKIVLAGPPNHMNNIKLRYAFEREGGGKTFLKFNI